MKKKLTKIIGVALAAVFSLGLFAGCDLISTNNQADMEQVVATVNVSNDSDLLESSLETLGSTMTSDVQSNIGEILSTDEIYKRDLVAYFISYGYNYLSQNGYDYAATFNQIMDELVQRKVLVQYATVYYLSEEEVRVDTDFIDFTEGYNSDPENPNGDAKVMDGDISVANYLGAIAAAGENATSDEIALAGLSIFLTDDEKKYAEYQVMQAINSSIDSYEQDIISADIGTSSTDTARTTPTGANEVAAFYPKTDSGELNYGVYTGFGDSNYGEYERVEGSTVVTRKRAYIRFLNALNQNYLLGEEEVSAALEDITALSYYTMELRNQYETLLINKFNASIALDMSEVFIENTLNQKYTTMLNTQKSSTTSFVTTMDSASDSSFVLYSPENRTYGYVYNILLPFNAQQTLTLTELQNSYGSETRAYYAARQQLYAGITAKDQRETWFTGSEDYSFDASEYGMTAGTDYYISENADGERTNSDYLFFKDNFVAQGNEAEGIDRYAGKYPYNGTVDVRKDGTYDLTPYTIQNIDDFIAEMEGFINYVAGYGENDVGRAHGTKDETFYDVTAADFGDNDNDIDYSKTIYYKGSVDIGYPADKEDKAAQQEFAANYMQKEGSAYKVLSAVNELMFAYSTDTGCLNSYLGYSIASKEEATDYVAEFEYAAQDAITNGDPGTYYVVATDYGWHILYVSYVYTGGDTYANFDYLQRTDPDTFSYFFYQAMKTSVAEEYSQEMIGVIFNRMQNSDSVVTKYEDRYSDLTSIGA